MYYLSVIPGHFACRLSPSPCSHLLKPESSVEPALLGHGHALPSLWTSPSPCSATPALLVPFWGSTGLGWAVLGGWWQSEDKNSACLIFLCSLHSAWIRAGQKMEKGVLYVCDREFIASLKMFRAICLSDCDSEFPGLIVCDFIPASIRGLPLLEAHTNFSPKPNSSPLIIHWAAWGQLDEPEGVEFILF